MALGVLLGGAVTVCTTNNRGFTPDELAGRALDKIVFVSDNSSTEIKEQVLLFKENIKNILIFYMNEAAKSERTNIINKLNDAGYNDASSIIN